MATNIPQIPDYVDEQDYEYILASYLGNVRDDVDKREGSVIWDSGAPCCIEIAKAYLYLQAMMGNAFAATAHGNFLEWRCEEQGIERKPATYAKRKGVFTNGAGGPFAITLGTEFSTVGETNLINFVVKEVFTQNGQTVPGSYILECTQAGEIGNQYFGEIVPAYDITGLATATLADILTPGEAEQDEEDLRAEYFEVVRQKPFGGNIPEYREFIESLDGVGTCQVYPVWNGGGTVKIVFIDSTYSVPSSTLVEAVQKAIDPHWNDEYAGKGLGKAPIGHVVTVVGAQKYTTNIQATVVCATGFTIQQIKQSIIDNIESYFFGLRQDWSKSTDLNEYSVTIIRQRIISAILNTPGVENVTECKLNGLEKDIELTENELVQQLPVTGEITLNG